MTRRELLIEIRRLDRLAAATEKRAVLLINKLTALRLRVQLLLRKLNGKATP